MGAFVIRELSAIYSHWYIWITLARQDIQMRYRRSILGPLWITISMAVTIYSLGFLYANLFHVQLDHYFPHLATGIIGWSLISGLINESCNVFVDAEQYIKSQESYISLYVMRLIIRNFIVFMHNIIVFIPIILAFRVPISWNILYVIPGLVLIGINAFFWCTVLGILGARYRDFAQIVSSIVQVVFFLTPVMWMPNSLSSSQQWIIQFNPFYHLLNLIRYPLIQSPVSVYGLESILLMTVLGAIFYISFVNTYKHRIVFWL